MVLFEIALEESVDYRFHFSLWKSYDFIYLFTIIILIIAWKKRIMNKQNFYFNFTLFENYLEVGI